LAWQSSMATIISAVGSDSDFGESFEEAGVAAPDSRAKFAADCPLDLSGTDGFAVADGEAFGGDLSPHPQANSSPTTHIHATELRMLICSALLSRESDESHVADVRIVLAPLPAREDRHSNQRAARLMLAVSG